MGRVSLDDGEKSPGELRYWAQTIDGVVYGCWYRLRGDDQIEVFARGHRVVVPLDAIALLPESVARAVLSQLRSPAAVSGNQRENAAGVQQPPSSDEAEPSSQG
jgi:hypothetical protein